MGEGLRTNPRIRAHLTHLTHSSRVAKNPPSTRIFKCLARWFSARRNRRNCRRHGPCQCDTRQRSQIPPGSCLTRFDRFRQACFGPRFDFDDA